jgi:hypothetical protein
MLPFTREQFFEVFSHYHRAVWPAPLVAYGLGLLVVLALWRWRGVRTDRPIGWVLAAGWIWTGVA